MNLDFIRLLGWIFPVLFAAGSVSLGADMGGPDLGDGGDGDGGAGDADLGDGGDGADGDGEGGGQDDLDEGDGQSGQQLTQEQRRAAAQESRLGPEAKNLLKELKDSADPKKIKLADRIRVALFSADSWKQAFPGGIRQARELRRAFDDVGGAEGIQALRDESQSLSDELQTIDQAWENGDPQFIASLAEENPETFSKMAPVILENWRKVDKDGYNYATARIFHNTLHGSGVLNLLGQMWALAETNKAQPGMAGIVAGLQKLGEFTDNIGALASQQPALRSDTGLKKLQSERSKFDQERATAFQKDVHAENMRNLESALTVHLGRALLQKNVKLAVVQAKDPERFQAMLREAESRLTAKFKADSGFQRQKDALMKNRDRAGVTRLYKRKMDELLGTDPNGPKIARAVANIFFRGAVKKSTGGGNQQQRGGNQQQRKQNNNGGGSGDSTRVLRVSSRPDPSQIDYGRTTDSMIMDGRCYLKGKKEIHAWR